MNNASRLDANHGYIAAVSAQPGTRLSNGEPTDCSPRFDLLEHAIAWAETMAQQPNFRFFVIYPPTYQGDA